jgi:tellurite resistance protein TehA-like permease
MSRQAGPTNEQEQYEKNTAPIDDGRDSPIRGSIGATLELFSKRRSTFLKKFEAGLQSGLPIDMSRPAIFIAVDPPSFTALAFTGMAQDVTATQIFSVYTNLNGVINQDIIPDILQLFALLMAIFLWTLAFWFFAIAFVSSMEAVTRNDFYLNWYVYVFPNVGFTIATIKIGERLDSNGIKGVGTGMAAVLFFLWIVIVVCHIKAIVNRKICWPGKHEDSH